MMREIKYIILHCADTPNDKYFDIEDIDRWHKEKGWSGCGYHFVITRDGKLQKGRDIERVGAHVYGYNSKSVGICLIGGKDKDNKPNLDMTLVQDGALFNLITKLKEKFPEVNIRGHYKVSEKTCPNFNVEKWLEESKL